MTGHAGWRRVVLVALVISSAVPFALLALWSVQGEWFFPALLPSGVTTAAWQSALESGTLAPALTTSAALASATSVLGCALALPAGRALARLRGWRRHIGAAAAFLPVATPPLALGTGLQVVLLAAGLGGTLPGVLLAHLVPAVGYLALFFLGTFSLWDGRPEEAARTLGATRGQVWWRVVLPALRRPIAEGATVGFLVSWTQFALTLTVGAGAVRTLPLEVLAYARTGEDRAAAIGALLLIVPPVAAFAALRWAVRRTTVVPA